MTARPLMVVALAAAALGGDQATKWFILTQVMQPRRVIEVTPFFNLTLGFNTGVSFGMFGEAFAVRPGLLALLTLGIAIAILAWALRARSAAERGGLSLIAGGALGNILDRWRQGAVTDFLDFHWQGWHWPAFNGADVFISVGVLMLLWASVKRAPKPETERQT